MMKLLRLIAMGAVIGGMAYVPVLGGQAAPDWIAKAREVVNEMAAGQYDKVETQYDSAMKSALPAGKLGDTWKQMLGQVGGFKSVVSDSSQTQQGRQIITLVCAFERATVDVGIAFNADGTLGGIHFRPHRDTTPWSAPSYAKPDSFHETEITVTFKRWKLPGTLTTPVGDGPFPIVVLVHGSGPHDEDETVGANKPFKDLAWGLASNGVAVLRYKKRTAQYGAEAVDDIASMTVSDETINDAKAAIDLASKQPKIDAKRVFMLGHSEGGYVAPRVADGDHEIAGLILLAADERPLEVLILDQLRYLSSFPGVPPEQAKKQIADAEQAAKTIESPDLNLGDTITVLGSKIPASYFLDLRGYDPGATAAKLKIPILILQGGRDYQVTTDDFEAWKKALAGHANVTFKLYPDLNHIFQSGEGKSKPTEYDKAGHMSETTIADIAGWVRNGGNAK
jgi:uncharacterized protein